MWAESKASSWNAQGCLNNWRTGPVRPGDNTAPRMHQLRATTPHHILLFSLLVLCFKCPTLSRSHWTFLATKAYSMSASYSVLHAPDRGCAGGCPTRLDVWRQQRKTSSPMHPEQSPAKWIFLKRKNVCRVASQHLHLGVHICVGSHVIYPFFLPKQYL